MASLLKKYITNRRSILSKEIQLRFLKRLYRLLENGYPLIDALETIKWDTQMIEAATQIIDSLKNGCTIDQAFEKAAFDHTITSYLYFVRANGDLQASIKKCIDMYDHRLRHVKKFQQIVRYPLFLLLILSILLFFIKRSVLPSFIDLFQASPESSSTIVLSIMIIDYLGNLVIVFCVLIIIGVLIWCFNKRKISIEKQIRLYNAIPIYRKFIKLQTSFLFATHISMLLKTGMSMKEILKNMSQQKRLPIIAYYSTLMTAELTKGFHITSLLSQLTLLEKQLSTIFQKNADVEALEKDLTVYADLVTEQLQQKITKAITFVQPIFFIILASFIIFIYVTLMWPMFQLIKTI